MAIVEFADFECPFCRRYVAVLDSIRQRYPLDVAVHFAHFPLPYHRFALPAARVAECARSQGRFNEMHDLLYSKQDSLGLKSWRSYGTEAGIVRIGDFDKCVANQAPVHPVTRDTVLANKLQVRGTPTIIINGWKFVVPPTFAKLDSVVQAERQKGKVTSDQ